MSKKKEPVRIRDIIFLSVLIILSVGILFIVYHNPVTENEDNTELIVGFHIKGEVNKSGYYELPYGARIKDAIEQASGATENADIDSVNLALIIEDGSEIIIPPLKKSIEKNEESKEDKVNINTASSEKLCTIKGIGESYAKRIIEYRERVGMFKNINEIKNVKGIGKNKFDEIKDYIEI